MRQPGPRFSFSKRLLCHYSSSPAILSQTSPPSLSSDPHDSLATFLAYARRTSLSRKSTLYIGTRYEYICQSVLTRLLFRSLARTGGRGDQGIDLQGQWALPTLPYELPALVSCKANKDGVGPAIIRELEGTVGQKGGVGVLVGKKEASKGVREALRRSAVGLVWVMVEEDADGRKMPDDEDTLRENYEQADEEAPVARVRQILWNEKVAMMGAAGLGAGVRYFEGRSTYLENEVYLTWKGRILEPGVDGTKPDLARFSDAEVTLEPPPTPKTQLSKENKPP